jgi:pyridoxine/pyridoxamine 5'-phosphate oxidase
MPPGYGVPTDTSGADLLPWSETERRLTESRNYWICSTRPDGRPHAAPVWGLWRSGALVFSTSRSSRKARNLAARPDAVAHTESGDDVVILEGPVEEIELTPELADAYSAKYDLRPEPDEANVWLALRPRVAQTWRERDFARTAARWSFD